MLDEQQNLSPTVEVRASAVSHKNLPPWFAEAVVILSAWKDWGRVKGLAELRWARASKRFEVIDLILVLLLFVISDHRSVRAFFKDLRTHREDIAALAAIWDRQQLPTRSGFMSMLRAVKPDLVVQVVPLFLSDLTKRLPPEGLKGLIDHAGRPWLIFDFDPTHMVTLDHPDSADPARPAVLHPRAESAAPGYPGRKRADAIRSRMTVLLSHAQMWALTFAQPGNGQRSPAVEMACQTIAWLRDHLPMLCTLPIDQLPMPRYECVVRADGEFGTVQSVAIIVRHGLHYLIRCKDYHAIFAQAAVQEALRPGSTIRMPSPDSPVIREVFDVPQIEWRSADSRLVVQTRVVITRSPLPPGAKRPSVGHLHEGFDYEVFVTDLPADAFSAAEIVAL